MRGKRFEMAGKWETRWKRVADDAQASTGGDRLLQAALTAVSPMYTLGAWAHRKAHDTGLARRQRVHTPVICVGNLTLGGTGKTPVVMWLARKLKEAGHRPAILSRGYGGRLAEMKTVPALVVSDGRHVQYPPDLVGDEPIEFAMALSGVPVVVGRRRAEAAALAERQVNADVFIMDDGFQHYALQRECDVVVVDASRPPRDLRRFPRGSLRESLRSLRRAHAVILTRCDLAPSGSLRPLVTRLRRRYPHLAIAMSVMKSEGLTTAEGDLTLRPAVLKGKRVYLFCGVGNPAAVEASSRALGLDVVEMERLSDHAVVSEEDLERMRKRMTELGADFLACTRKDAVKLSRELREHEQWPVLVVSSRLTFHPHSAEARVFEHIARRAFRMDTAEPSEEGEEESGE